jgi:surface antigen
MKDWKARAAKRIVAEDATKRALEAIEGVRVTGGPESSPNKGYVIAMYLLRHAAEQLRLSEETE